MMEPSNTQAFAFIVWLQFVDISWQFRDTLPQHPQPAYPSELTSRFHVTLHFLG